MHFLRLTVSNSNGGNTNTQPRIDSLSIDPASVEATTVKLIATAPLQSLQLRLAGCPLWDNQRVETFPATTNSPLLVL